MVRMYGFQTNTQTLNETKFEDYTETSVLLMST